MSDRYIDIHELRAKLAGRSIPAIDLDVATGSIPLPVKLGQRRYWIETEVDQHLRELRDKQAKARSKDAG